MDLDILALLFVIKIFGNLLQCAFGFMEISFSVFELLHFEKKFAKNRFLALVKKVLISAFFNFSENFLTLLGCGVQTTYPTETNGVSMER